ncbi:aldo/keto reductase [uncultured Flavobacterium sp.]|uniref:aldo/keto reductase n=1 Tax=uncultured Flavobacterium sp. TaxID=165435 RepID=UPI0030ECD8B2|tara:strand:+ start:36960 stop:37829 length:870 start_codon:yes stop_codon:yes gene_type:complete
MSIKLSSIVAGVMNWGVWDKNLNTQEMTTLIHTFLAQNITSFDHADIYGGYTTEASFGKAFSQSKIDRKSIQLISKCGIKYPSESRAYGIKHYDYSAEYIIWSAENSLKNLQSDYLDVFLLHRPSPLMRVDEVAKAVEQLKSQGKILSFGVSNFTNSQTELLQKSVNVEFNQIQFSATHFEAMLDGSLDYMQSNNITPLAWNPLGSMFKEDTEQTRRLKKLLTTLVSKYEVSSDLILLAWILQHPSNIIPAVGTTNLTRIPQLNKASSLKLDLEDWFAIWTESMGNRVP